jgi:hypothetical protein
VSLLVELLFDLCVFTLRSDTTGVEVGLVHCGNHSERCGVEIALLLFADLLSNVVLSKGGSRRVWADRLRIGGGLMLYRRHGYLVRTGNYAASTKKAAIPT